MFWKFKFCNFQGPSAQILGGLQYLEKPGSNRVKSYLTIGSLSCILVILAFRLFYWIVQLHTGYLTFKHLFTRTIIVSLSKEYRITLMQSIQIRTVSFQVLFSFDRFASFLGTQGKNRDGMQREFREVVCNHDLPVMILDQLAEAVGRSQLK